MKKTTQEAYKTYEIKNQNKTDVIGKYLIYWR
jgi:hypothetical protein